MVHESDAREWYTRVVHESSARDYVSGAQEKLYSTGHRTSRANFSQLGMGPPGNFSRLGMGPPGKKI